MAFTTLDSHSRTTFHISLYLLQSLCLLQCYSLLSDVGPLGNLTVPSSCACTVHNFPGLKYLHPLCLPWLHGSAGQVLLIAAVLRLELSTQLTPPEILTARKTLSTLGWGTTVTVTRWTSKWGKGTCRVKDEMTGSCLWGEADQGSMGSPSIKGQIDTIVDWGKHISTRVPGEICLDWFIPVWTDIYQSGPV